MLLIFSIFPSNISFRLFQLDQSEYNLTEDEIKLSKKFKSRLRSQQFKLGRTLARKNLLELSGPTNWSLLSDKNGLAIWPKGFTGSISHSKELVAVATAKNDSYLAIGLDIEKKENINPKILDRICIDSEKKILSNLVTYKEAALLAFSIKESCYKLIYSFTKKTNNLARL